MAAVTSPPMRSLVFVTAVVSLAASSGAYQSSLIIRNITVIDATGAPPRVADIEVRGDRIHAIAPKIAGSAVRTVDGTGKFAIPGLWDMHAHLATRPEPELAEQMILPLLLAHGIVGVRDMGGPLERVLDLKRKVADGSLAGPRILTPGPFVDGPGEASPMFVRPEKIEAVAAQVQSLKGAGVDFVKAQSGLTPELHSAVAAAAKTSGLPLAGHIPVAMTAEEVVRSGQRTIEHISPALVGDGLLLFACSSRADEVIAEVRSIEAARGTIDAQTLARREAALRVRVVETYDPAKARALGALIRERDVWVVPTLVWSAALRPTAVTQDGSGVPMEFVPRALRTRWMERRKAYIAQVGTEGVKAAAALATTAARAVADLHAGGAKVLAGTDAFDAFVIPGFSLHQELQMLVTGGLSPLTALQAATREAAAFRGRLEHEGTLEAGKLADIVLLDANPLNSITNTTRVSAVIKAGTMLEQGAIDGSMARVRSFADR